MADETPPEHVPNPDATPPIPPQTAMPRGPQHRQAPAGPRAPFLPADHLPAKHHLKP